MLDEDMMDQSNNTFKATGSDEEFVDLGDYTDLLPNQIPNAWKKK